MDNRQFYIKEFDNNYYYNFKSRISFLQIYRIICSYKIFDMRIFKENMEVIKYNRYKSITRLQKVTYRRILENSR